MAPQLSQEQRKMIVDMKEAGHSIKNIERTTGITVSVMIHEWVCSVSSHTEREGITVLYLSHNICSDYVEHYMG